MNFFYLYLKIVIIFCYLTHTKLSSHQVFFLDMITINSFVCSIIFIDILNLNNKKILITKYNYYSLSYFLIFNLKTLIAIKSIFMFVLKENQNRLIKYYQTHYLLFLLLLLLLLL